MAAESFRALVVAESNGGTFTRSLTRLTFANLPEGEVLIRVAYSSLNYKDGLSASGNRGVTKRYPHIPGVDAAGIVHESSVTQFSPGDEVVVHGFELGANHWGGFSEYIRVPAAWIVRKPEGLSLRETMMYGTAGFTSGLAVHRLLHNGLAPDQGQVLVTGATGGVGCIAVALLARLGFTVVASTGKTAAKDFLVGIGASEVIDRNATKDLTGKPLLNGRWAGAVDTVGGDILDSTLRYTKLFGSVATCGNVISGDLHTSVYPFILRGVALLGINSAFTPMPLRLDVWEKLGRDWKLSNLEQMTKEISLEDLEAYFDVILKGGVRGRILVRISS